LQGLAYSACRQATQARRKIRDDHSMTYWKLFFFLSLIVFLYFFPIFSMAGERLVSVNAWPLFHYTSDPVEGESEVEGLGPFFYWRKDSARKEWGVRPLLYWTRDEQEPLKRLEFVYPFGKYQVREDDRGGYLFPISRYRREMVEGKKKWDFQFFPFFIGETEQGEDYYGFFPLYGFLLNRYGKENIRFYLWPLYSESISEGTRTRNLIWPFFALLEGENTTGYRLWPFYGQREEFGVSKSEFLLWPIFLRKTKGLDTDEPMKERMAFPFYIGRTSKNFESNTYLWPFFSHVRERTTGFEQWDLPWPLFRTFHGENLYGMRFFILYGYKVREGNSKRVFVVYPLYQYEEDSLQDVEERTYRILFSRVRIDQEADGVEKERSVRIWPLFEFERKETGQKTFSFLYLFPFKEEGFERNLFPLFRIFHWKRDPQGKVSANLLWGLFQKMEKGESSYWEVAYLIGIKKGKGWKEVSLLKGLFLYQREEEDASLRLLFLPFSLRWSHRHPDASPLKKEEDEGFRFQKKEDHLSMGR
jgi:hypothetical protein